MSQCPVRDSAILFNIYSQFLMDNKTSCSASLNRLRKNFPGLNSRLKNMKIRTLHNHTNLLSLCQATECLTDPEWNALIQAASFKKTKLKTAAPNNDRVISSKESDSIALMAVGVVHEEIVHLMEQAHSQLPRNCRRDILDEGAPAYRERIWNTIRLAINDLTPTVVNFHKESHPALKNIDPRSIFVTFLVLISDSQGFFDDTKSFKTTFRKYKSKVTSLEFNYKISGHHTSGDELVDEIYSSYLGRGNGKDLMTFFCWLEWREDLNNYGWLSRMDLDDDDHDHGDATDPVSTPPKKRGKKVHETPPLRTPDPFMSVLSEKVDESEIERNRATTTLTNIQTQNYLLESLRSVIAQEHVTPMLTPDNLRLAQAKYNESVAKMCEKKN
jgi:hypothetical protein